MIWRTGIAGKGEGVVGGFFDDGSEVIWIILIILVLVFLFNGFDW
jgi:uncharacterized membrane protein